MLSGTESKKLVKFCNVIILEDLMGKICSWNYSKVFHKQ